MKLQQNEHNIIIWHVIHLEGFMCTYIKIWVMHVMNAILMGSINAWSFGRTH